MATQDARQWFDVTPEQSYAGEHSVSKSRIEASSDGLRHSAAKMQSASPSPMQAVHKSGGDIPPSESVLSYYLR